MSIVAPSPTTPTPRERARLCVRGTVQGVGFRPFVYRLAQALGLAGFVVNTPAGVSIEVEGAAGAIDTLVARIEREPPPNALVTDLAREALAPVGDRSFEIRESVLAGVPTATISTGSCHLRRLLREDFRHWQSALSLSLHQLHKLRAALFDHRRPSLRSDADNHACIPVVRVMRSGIWRPAKPTLPRRAERLSGLRTPTHVVGSRGLPAGGM